MAEYAVRYGGLPDAAEPWPMIAALLERVNRFESRGMLRAMDASASGVSQALAGAFGGDTSAFRTARKKLESQAFGKGNQEPDYLVNRAAQTDG